MRVRNLLRRLATSATCALALAGGAAHAASHAHAKDDFRLSRRCVACHNGLKTPQGEDISIGLEWSASVMANAARDPYWQASVRRETMDHPAASADIQDECSTCHMPMQHLIDRMDARKTLVFQYLPLNKKHNGNLQAADGVSCSVCHQIEATGLGTQRTFSGNVDVAAVKDRNHRPEYGPFLVDAAHQRIMQSSTAGFVPTQAAHVRDSALCGSCHTLYTTARDTDGKPIGRLPEQMPYLEWLHSDYPSRDTCQQCHMPPVAGAVRVASAYGPDREGMHRHVFVGGNVLLESLLNEHRAELGTKAVASELDEALDRTRKFVTTQSATVAIEGLHGTARGVEFNVRVENKAGHKLPTAFPSRRAWLHVTVRDASGRVVFESGALRPDGSIAGNDNDADKRQFEPHYSTITRPDQVEIYESILKDRQGRVTTGLIDAVGYLKDNRILPTGFDKATAEKDIAVIGRAANDSNFTGGQSSTRYVVDVGSAKGPFHVEAELWYQPVGYRWAHNLDPYKAYEPQRFVGYFNADAQSESLVLARAEATR